MINCHFNSLEYWRSRHEQYLTDPRGVGNVIYSSEENEKIYVAMNEYIEKLVRVLNKPSPVKVLDLGCGIGMISGAFIRTGCIYTGVDISENAIEIARKKHPSGTFFVGNIANLPFNEYFDIIIERTVFIHLVEDDYWRSVICEVKRLLSSHGLFILMDCLPESAAEVPGKGPHVKFRLYSEYEDVFNEAGLKFNLNLKNMLSTKMEISPYTHFISHTDFR